MTKTKEPQAGRHGAGKNERKLINNTNKLDSKSQYNADISIFQGINKRPTATTTWPKALEDIRSDKYKKAIEKVRGVLHKYGSDSPEYRGAKIELPAVTFGGTFAPRRAKVNIVSPTGIIIPDLDHLDAKTEIIFRLLAQDRNVWFVFKSPSGKGIKAGIRGHKIKNDEDHKKLFFAVERYFREVYGLGIDPSCKDISRLTFVSHDPELWVNPEPCYFDIKAWEKPPPAPPQPVKPAPITNSTGKEKYARKVLESCCEEIRQSLPGNQHHTRLKAARLIGGYLHYIDEAEVLSALEQAVIASGAKRIAPAMKTVRDGLEYGELSPITIPNSQSPTETHNSETKGSGQVQPQDLWEKPVLLDDFSLPEMEAVPGIIGEFSQAVSAATETPLELAMGMCLATVATACQKKFIVQVKPGYSEPLNIYVNALLNSGERKTSVHTEMTRPLATWEKQQRFEMEPLVKEAEIQRKNQEARIKSLRARYGKAKRDELNEIEDDIRELESKLVEAPVMPKIWVQDITPEHLGTVMSLHNEKIAILSAEGGIFDIMAGRYSRGIPNLDLFLQGHSGDPVRVDRGSRDSIFLEHPALTMGLSTQPEVLQSIADAPGFRGRGLLARFLYLLPKSRLGHRTLETEPVPQHVKEEYESLIHTLLNIEPPTDEHGNNVPYSLHLKRSAYKEWLEFSKVVEKDLPEGGRFENITDWAGKLPGATARIAGILHCVKHPQQAWVDQISLETMQQALGLGAIFSCHALKAFNLMGADKSLEGAKKAWRWVERGRFKSFRKNNIYNALKGTFPRVADIEPCLDVLEERNYILPLKEKKVGRPSIIYAVNPNFCERWS